MRNKITIVGVGNVGASCALWLAKRGLADLVLVDIPAAKTMPVGKGLDLLQAGPIEHYNARLRGNADGSYEGTENSDSDEHGVARRHRQAGRHGRDRPCGSAKSSPSSAPSRVCSSW